MCLVDGRDDTQLEGSSYRPSQRVTKMAKAKTLRDRLIFVKTSKGCDTADAKTYALEYLVSFIEFLEAGNPKVTEAIQRRIDTIDKVLTREERAKIALSLLESNTST